MIFFQMHMFTIVFPNITLFPIPLSIISKPGFMIYPLITLEREQNVGSTFSMMKQELLRKYTMPP